MRQLPDFGYLIGTRQRRDSSEGALSGHRTNACRSFWPAQWWFVASWWCVAGTDTSRIELSRRRSSSSESVLRRFEAFLLAVRIWRAQFWSAGCDNQPPIAGWLSQPCGGTSRGAGAGVSSMPGGAFGTQSRVPRARRAGGLRSAVPNADPPTATYVRN